MSLYERKNLENDEKQHVCKQHKIILDKNHHYHIEIGTREIHIGYDILGMFT